VFEILDKENLNRKYRWWNCCWRWSCNCDLYNL